MRSQEPNRNGFRHRHARRLPGLLVSAELCSGAAASGAPPVNDEFISEDYDTRTENLINPMWGHRLDRLAAFRSSARRVAGEAVAALDATFPKQSGRGVDRRIPATAL